MNADHNRDQAILIQTQSPLPTFERLPFFGLPNQKKGKTEGAYRVKPVKL